MQFTGKTVEEAIETGLKELGITEEQAESIRRWETSKYGQKEITIVRKIPFAIFISFGTIVYVIMRLILI